MVSWMGFTPGQAPVAVLGHVSGGDAGRAR